MLARVFRLAAKAGVRGVVAFSDVTFHGSWHFFNGFGTASQAGLTGL